MAATVYCASNTAFHQHSLTNSRAQFSPVLRRTSLLAASPLVPTAAIPSTEQPVVLLARKGDENNNDDYFEDSREGYLADDFPMTRDDADPTGNDHEDEPDLENLDDAEEFLSLIGLRPKMKQSTAPSLSRRPLTQRLASPVCLLPLPKYVERVRQALYVRLPFLKFLSTVTDVESFCSTDASAKAQSLLPRSAAQTRALSSLFKGRKKRKLAKTDFVDMAAYALRYPASKMSNYHPVHSALRCYVVLDRLKQSTIDQIMQSSSEDACVTVGSLSPPASSNRKPTRASLPTTQTEKSVVKRKSMTTVANKAKRFKSVENDIRPESNMNGTPVATSSFTYQRIYLKCFLCSKRSYVDARLTDSDVLHSHWLEHGGKLLLNIYDTEIDSILTRVVEFFKSPKQQLLEGKVRTVFILNSKEIRSNHTSSSSSSPNDSYIVLD